MSQSLAGEISDSFNTNSFNNVCNVNYFGGADERSEILSWLSPLEPRIRHDDVRAQRVEGVGDWLLRTEEYRNWFDGVRGEESDNSALFCYGAPGVGKTYISSLVIDTLCDRARGQNIAVPCVYLDFASQKEQSPTNILGSLLKQLVGGLEDIPAKLVQEFRDQKQVGGRRLGLAELVEMFQDVSSSRRIFICIDAIDECVAEYRAKLLDSLKQILQNTPGTRIFMAGRLHILGEVENHLTGRLAAVSVTPTKDDIVLFLRAKLKEDTTPDAIDKSLEEGIFKNIPETVSEIFLLVSLNIKAILQETTIHRRREKLDSMTNGLGLEDAYDATIGRIRALGEDRARLGMATLMWVSHSERPLKVDEICHALAVEIGSADINNNNVPSIRTVLSCCQGLVVVDGGSSTIRLIHFTLKEYLSGHAGMFDRAHSKIAEACLTYLDSRTINALPAGSSHDPRDAPLLEYSSLYWGTHMRMDYSDHSRHLALNLLDRYQNHISVEFLWNSISEKYYAWYLPGDGSFSALHCISYFGIAEVAINLIKMKRWDVNQRDSMGMTPLMWAARCGHEEVVKSLLGQKDAEPDIRDTGYGRTALSWAAGNGHEGVVRLFLGRRFVNLESMGRRWGGAPRVRRLLFGKGYINPDSRDKGGGTPLSWAAGNGHGGVVKLLLGREDVSPDRPNNYGRVPLLIAAMNGHDGVVELLLGLGKASPGRPDRWGQTPLLLAAKNGHYRIVKALLDRNDIDPDKQDKVGGTALSFAALGGHEGVVKLLLGRADVSPDRPGGDGQTPLSLAATNGHDGVVKLLLKQKDINLDRPDRWGQVALSRAAKNGHDEIVRLLLGREDMNPDRPDNDGRTPLSLAAKNGYKGVVRSLLGREDVHPNRPDNGGQTPLSLAAMNGHDGVVKLLLGREDVSPDRPDNDGQTPLLLAAKNGHDGVVKKLSGRNDINPDKQDKSGRTALSRAARSGHDGVVKLLLGRGGISPDRPEPWYGQTPLLLAAGNGHDGIVKLLLEREDVNPDGPDKWDQTPLSWAARGGHEGVVKLLVGRAGVGADRQDNDGQTPLSWAAVKGHEGVVKLLLEQEDINPDKPDRWGQAALSRAAKNGHDGVVRLLLGVEGINLDRPDGGGQTPLSLAARNGCEGVVKLLLGLGAVGLDRPDNGGQTPLSWAAKNGRWEVARLLLGRGDISPDKPDEWGQTPLLLAARNGHDMVVKLLLGREDVNPDRPDTDGQTPLMLAAKGGHDAVVKLLIARKAADLNVA